MYLCNEQIIPDAFTDLATKTVIAALTGVTNKTNLSRLVMHAPYVLKKLAPVTQATYMCIEDGLSGNKFSLTERAQDKKELK